ncbi:hypothetical protein [Anoxybacillus eryuanensis]|nr:hypothetical protein [Anoxybacillus tengchongensis]
MVFQLVMLGIIGLFVFGVIWLTRSVIKKN